MLVNTNVYNYLSTSLVPKRRNTTHKASELKAVYNSISKYNKTSPLYLVNLSESKQSHMVQIKESALTLQDLAQRFSDPADEMSSKNNLKTDNPDSVTGSFRKHASGNLPEHMDIEVHKLATQQVNTGTALESDELDIPLGSHSIFIQTDIGRIPFTIPVAADDTNLSIQQNLAARINERNLGITANVIKNGENSMIKIQSDNTGASTNENGLYFYFESDENNRFIDALGLNQITTNPENSIFSVNGTRHSSTSNHISINQTIELDFHQISDKPVNLMLTMDTQALQSQLDSFIEAYNHLVDLSNIQTETTSGSRNLYHDIASIVSRHRDDFSALGLTTDENHYLVKDPDTTEQADLQKLTEIFGEDSSLKSDILKSKNRLTLDPVAYINKLTVTYPNAKEKQMLTYTQSLYSGLMYNNYA